MATKTSFLSPPDSGPIRSVAGMTAYTLLRVVVGVIMVAHGAQKVTRVSAFEDRVADLGFPLPEVFARLAIAGELLGGAGLLVGFLTPIAAFGALAVMVSAIVTVHLDHGLFAERGGFEYPLVLASAALMFMLNGAGAYSVDAVVAKNRGMRRVPSSVRPTLAPELPVHEMPRPSGAVPSDGEVDPVTQAGMESFPASDPPAHSHRS